MQVAQLCNEPFSIVHMIAFLTSIYSHLKSSSSSHNLSRIITTIKINCNYGGSQCRSLSVCERDGESETHLPNALDSRVRRRQWQQRYQQWWWKARNYSQALGENRTECYRHSHHHHHHHHHHRRTPDVE